MTSDQLRLHLSDVAVDCTEDGHFHVGTVLICLAYAMKRGMDAGLARCVQDYMQARAGEAARRVACNEPAMN